MEMHAGGAVGPTTQAAQGVPGQVRRTAAAEDPALEGALLPGRKGLRDPCPTRLVAVTILVSAAGGVAPHGVRTCGVTAMVGRRDVGRPTQAGTGGAGAIALSARLGHPEPGVQVAAAETTVPRLLRRAPQPVRHAPNVGVPTEPHVRVGAGAARVDRGPSVAPTVVGGQGAARLHARRFRVAAPSETLEGRLVHVASLR